MRMNEDREGDTVDVRVGRVPSRKAPQDRRTAGAPANDERAAALELFRLDGASSGREGREQNRCQEQEDPFLHGSSSSRLLCRARRAP